MPQHAASIAATLVEGRTPASAQASSACQPSLGDFG